MRALFRPSSSTANSSRAGAARLRAYAHARRLPAAHCLIPLTVLSMAADARRRADRRPMPPRPWRSLRNLNRVVRRRARARRGSHCPSALSLLIAASVAQLREICSARWRRCSAASSTPAARSSPTTRSAPWPRASTRWCRACAARGDPRDLRPLRVSPEVRDEILSGQISVAGTQREVTILFADLRDFTPWVERTAPAEVVASLNAYFGEMDAAIRAHAASCCSSSATRSRPSSARRWNRPATPTPPWPRHAR